MAAVAPLPFTVISAMTACGLDLASAATFAAQIFMDDFEYLRRRFQRQYLRRAQDVFYFNCRASPN